jgi:hypothetical protein
MAITIAGDLLIATALTLDRNPSLFASSVTRLQCQAILSTETSYTARQSLGLVPTMVVRPK